MDKVSSDIDGAQADVEAAQVNVSHADKDVAATVRDRDATSNTLSDTAQKLGLLLGTSERQKVCLIEVANFDCGKTRWESNQQPAYLFV